MYTEIHGKQYLLPWQARKPLPLNGDVLHLLSSGNIFGGNLSNENFSSVLQRCYQQVSNLLNNCDWRGWIPWHKSTGSKSSVRYYRQNTHIRFSGGYRSSCARRCQVKWEFLRTKGDTKLGACRRNSSPLVNARFKLPTRGNRKTHKQRHET